MTFNSVSKAFSTVALAALACVGANAGTYTTTPETESLGPFGTTGAPHALIFNKFDTSLGTLTQINITLGGTAEATYQFIDVSGSTNNFQFTGTVTVNLENPLGGSPLAIAIPGLSDIPRSVGPNGTYQVPGYPDPLVSPLTGSNSSGLITITAPPTLLAAFSGTGQTISLNTDATILTQFNANNDAQETVFSRYSASGTISYTYTTPDTGAPEPASMVLLGSALVGVGLIGRKRLAKR